MTNKETSWGKVASWYEDVVNDTDSYQQQVILPNITRLLQLQKTDDVLDLACGTGFFTGHFAPVVQSIVGVDIGEQLIAKAKKAHPKLQFAVTSADDLSQFKHEQFSKITLILAIQNIEQVSQTLKEMYRVLKPGGRAYIVINHPAFRIPKRSGWGWDEALKQQYRRIDGYLHESKEAIDMHPGQSTATKTISFHRPLQYYFKTAINAGFLVGRLEEWISHRVSQAGPRQKEEDRMRKEIPLFMCLELCK